MASIWYARVGHLYKSDKFCNSDTIVIHLPYIYAIICMSDKFAGLTSDTLKWGTCASVLNMRH